MKKRATAVSKTVAAVALVVVLALAVLLAYLFVLPRGLPFASVTTTSLCAGCFITQPVVDIIIPSLIAHATVGGADNAPVNVTQGEQTTLLVEVYPSTSVNVSMHFSVLQQPGSSGGNILEGNFSPPNLAINAQGKGNSSLALKVASGAAIGAYTVDVYATDLENSSWNWGTVFTVNVS